MKLSEEFKRDRERNKNFETLFLFYEQLSSFLAIKSELGIELRNSYKIGKDILNNKIKLIDEAIERLEILHNCWSSLWFSTNKAFGFEIIDLRLGGLKSRLLSSKKRLKSYCVGEINIIEEFEEEELLLLREEETNILNGIYVWKDIISGCKI